MRFAADDMLGKLARWLRMMGVDVTWSNRVSDAEVIRQGRDEARRQGAGLAVRVRNPRNCGTFFTASTNQRPKQPI
ncbi:MAG TPA: Mut7-C RNAse domain-containing protein [bacterium]|nr:Mut7-C RNAse domain-containing protein [bacterium]